VKAQGTQVLPGTCTRGYCKDDSSSIAKSSLTPEVPKLSPQELNVNSKSAPSQIARAPNGEKIRKFSRVQNLTGTSFFSKIFTCDYTRCVVCLPIWIISLFISPFALYSSSYPILRGTPSGDCPDEDAIASPKLWPPLRAYRGGPSRLHFFDARCLLMLHPYSSGVYRKEMVACGSWTGVHSVGYLAAELTVLHTYQFEELCSALGGC
jgi:hypothetical protein